MLVIRIRVLTTLLAALATALPLLVGLVLPAPADQQHLKQVAMAVRSDRPIMDRGARGDGLDMNEIEGLIVRRIAVEMEERQRSGGHVKS